jgi:deoxyribodipyrimidine photo-lyase
MILVLPYNLRRRNRGISSFESYFLKPKTFCLRNKKRNGGRRLFFKILCLVGWAISPRTIYDQVKKEEMYGNDSTYWLVLNCCGAISFDLCLKNTKLSFLVCRYKSDSQIQNPWMKNYFRNGLMGNVFGFYKCKYDRIEANRFYEQSDVKTWRVIFNRLNMDWRLGAAYFESQLIDYDVCSNWNWAYLAGVSNDPENTAILISRKQGDYDKDSVFRDLWLIGN